MVPEVLQGAKETEIAVGPEGLQDVSVACVVGCDQLQFDHLVQRAGLLFFGEFQDVLGEAAPA